MTTVEDRLRDALRERAAYYSKFGCHCCCRGFALLHLLLRSLESLLQHCNFALHCICSGNASLPLPR